MHAKNVSQLVQDPQQVKNFPRAFRGKVRSNTQRRKQRAEEVMGLLEFAESHACLDRRQITAALRIQNPRLWREYTGNRCAACEYISVYYSTETPLFEWAMHLYFAIGEMRSTGQQVVDNPQYQPASASDAFGGVALCAGPALQDQQTMWRSNGASTASATASSRPATLPCRAFQQGLVSLPVPCMVACT